MGRKGLAARTLTLLVAALMVLPVPTVVDTADGAGPPGLTGSKPPASGDWDINETTVVSGQDLDLSCNVTVHAPHSLTIIDSNISVNRSGPHPYLLKVESNASLVVEGSALNLSELQADTYADVTLSNSTIATSGQFLAGCVRLRAYGCTILNTAPDGPSDRHGGDAVLTLGGGEESEVKDCVVVNRGGDAGLPLIVAYGMAGGTARLVSNASSWVNCTVEDTAGSPRDGRPDWFDDPGSASGAGGAGGLAECTIQASRIEGVDLTVQASSGGSGAKGVDDLTYNASDGGDGGGGGDAIVRITSASALDLHGCRLRANADWGGSGGPGGQSAMGKGGDAGQAGIAGKVEVNVSAAMDLIMDDTVMRLTGGSGGWGGDYGRSDSGTWGATAPGSGGGLAALDMYCGGDMTLRRVSLKASGGVGSDGGTGYDQGGRGGGGGSAILRVRSENRIVAEDIVLSTDGGMGANGGPAFSNIFGNGGDGGNATVELNGTERMQIKRFTFDIKGGKGGKGNNPTWVGEGGVPDLAIVTHRLEMWNGTLGWRLSGLPDDAETDLYDVYLNFGGMGIVQPIGYGIIRTWYTVEIMVVDHHDPSLAKPRVNTTVIIESISTREQVATCRTDADGVVSNYLQSFNYTPAETHYVGGYLVTAVYLAGKLSRTVRIDVQGPRVRPDPFLIVLSDPSYPPTIYIEHPSEDETYTLTYLNTTLEVNGYATDQDEYPIQCMTVRLYPVGDPLGDWPAISLNRSDIPLSQVKGTEERWGKYFPPEPNQNKWRFFYRYNLTYGDIHLPSGEYILRVTASDGSAVGMNTTRILIIVWRNSPPHITLAMDLDRVDWNSTKPLMLSGTSSDDHGVLRVEVRVDDGAWEAANGTLSWSILLDLGSLAEGFHTIEVRATDGELVSPTVSHTFTIERPETPDGNGGGSHSPPPFVWAMVAIVLAVIAILAVVLLRRRKRSDA